MKRRRHNDNDEDNDDAVLSQFVVLQIDGAGSIVLGSLWMIYNARQNLMYDFTHGKNSFLKYLKI